MSRHRITPALLVKFIGSGGIVAVVNLGLFTLLYGVLGVAPQAAVALAFAGGLVAHFTLNRHLVFKSQNGYLHPLNAQVVRYLAVAVFSYVGTAVGTAVIPALTPLSPLAAYWISAQSMAFVVFLLLRAVVFVPTDRSADVDHARVDGRAP